MTTRTRRTLTTAAVLAIFGTASAAYAQAGQSSPAAHGKQARSKAHRGAPDRPVVSLPWWAAPSSVKVLPPGGSSTPTSPSVFEPRPVRVFISKPDDTTPTPDPVPASVAHDVHRPDGLPMAGAIALSDGRVLQRDGTILKEGEVVSRDASIALPEGRVAKISDLLTREGAAFGPDGTITLNDGRVLRIDAPTPTPVHQSDARAGAPGARPVPKAAQAVGGAALTKAAPSGVRRATIVRSKPGIQRAGVPIVAPAAPKAAPSGLK